MKVLVIDASVALKWFFDDEDHLEDAISLLRSYTDGTLELLAPDILYHEVLNAFLIAKRRKRIRNELIDEAIDGFLALEIEFASVLEIAGRVLHYAEQYGLTFYDASYIALAEEKEALMVTSDRRLYEAVRKEITFVKHLGDV